MPNFRSTAALVVAAVVAASIMAPAAHAGAAYNCDWYAKISLKQNTERQAKKCNLGGPQWNSSFEAHKTWCGTVPPNVWLKQVQDRKAQLKTCK